MAEKTCTLVFCSTGNKYAYLPVAERVFYNHADLDGNPKGWVEAKGISWLSYSRRILHADDELENQPIPKGLEEIL